ncbi:hypothetical protein [Streptomyces monomycini]|uniref:hypothetical protein n=1 Tax=Streptomyces monomycini TaxID=371720 RepID=UPI0004AB7C2B|nr:hypothetical protein [Streptomyces monomycini]
MTFVLVAAAVLVVETVVLLLACFGVEQRDRRHSGEPGGEDEASPQPRDEAGLGPGPLYAVATLAMVGTAVLSGIDFEWSVGTLGVLGVLVPGYAGRTVRLLSTRGRGKPFTGWQEVPAYVLAALGGAAAVAFN